MFLRLSHACSVVEDALANSITTGDRYTCWKKGGRTRAGTWVPDTIPFQLEDKEDKEDKEGSQDNKD